MTRQRHISRADTNAIADRRHDSRDRLPPRYRRHSSFLEATSSSAPKEPETRAAANLVLFAYRFSTSHWLPKCRLPHLRTSSNASLRHRTGSRPDGTPYHRTRLAQSQHYSRHAFLRRNATRSLQDHIIIDPSSLESLIHTFDPTIPSAVHKKLNCTSVQLGFRLKPGRNLVIIPPTSANALLAPTRVQSGKVLDAIRMLSGITSCDVYVEASKLAEDGLCF
ncbi:hypothetical protein NXS19_011181 [Fusarium pseudograminearum]|nr:hypothetical protein NXS19_011181 [Fusarium pseudograminearum]